VGDVSKVAGDLSGTVANLKDGKLPLEEETLNVLKES
jgi:hypothetical protein